ncbi:thioredoxin [Candidatus Woesearchaeota archaeon]|jgi:thioredoxin 1|nr:MAG: thioredoxin [Candidatus Woesearchaeota archaeon]
MEITAENFDQAKNSAVVIDFWAQWCGPCKVMLPIVEKMHEEFGDKVAKCNVDEQPELAQSLGISSIPCFIFFKAGEEVHRHVGTMTEDEFREKIKTYL